MSFARRYVTSLVAPPAIVTLPLAFLFITQVVQLSLGTAFVVIALLLLLGVGTAAALFAGLTPAAESVEEAVAAKQGVSDAVSDCLQKTTTLALLIWLAGGLVFAVLATVLVMRTPLGFAYFLVAGLITAFPSIAWSYGAGKHRLVEYATGSEDLRYTGRELTLGRKIAIVFMGSLLVAAAVLIELISSKVSTTLEALAVSSASERFDRVYDSANVMAHVDAQALDTMREYIPPDYAIHLITRDGKMISTKDPLTADEVREILRIKKGDSTAFISPHVVRFAPLKDGSIFVLAIPWTPYQGIPLQITFYTILIVLFTMAAFAAAAYFLSRDITRPLHDLQNIAEEMAVGNFNAAARVFSDDELGQLAVSFGETRSNLRRLLGRIGGSGSIITDGVRVITGGTESLLVRARDQAEITENSSLAVENMRGGISMVLGAADGVTDLTQDASSRSLQMQASAEEVARSTEFLFQSVEKTSSSTTEMNASMREMSGRTDVLAGIADEALSFVSEMDSTIEQLRQTAQQTADISQIVAIDAGAGGEAVNRTVEGINASEELTIRTAETLDDLQRSVGQISQILNVIEEVTNRTNLLALNAAIIAAQAGEHGAGFTVVADEIRQLAERTRGSTKEIATIIKAVQNGSRQAVTRIHEGVVKVRENVELAKRAATSLEKIVGSAGRSQEMAITISRALDDQAKASRHLHEVTSRMSDHIAEINRATREQARGTQLLAQEAERVREIAGQVKTATDEQSMAGRGITLALEKISEDARNMRDLLDRQLTETDRIADASRTMLDIAQQNDAIAREFNSTVQNLVRSGQEFESEVSRFRG
ncbi:MAG TPA: methyl-accepting chemotaxis protein [Thermoanaerobaculia bacterium]|jgi:methyl-accepting chemotaxis protein